MKYIRKSWLINHLEKFWQEFNFTIILFLVWRLVLFTVGLVSFRIFTFKASFAFIDEILISSHWPQWFWHWGNFDGVHYLVIAQHGYAGLIANEEVFFPLYPISIRLLTVLTRNYFLSGFLISNISAFLVGLVFYRLIKRQFSQSTAKWALLFLFAFPTSFFLGAIYSESLFLLLILLSFYHRDVGKWLFSSLAGLTRLVGAFVGVGLAGLAAYMIYLWATFGRPLYFLNAQGSFANNRANSLATLVTPPQVVFRYLKIFLTANPAHYDFWIAVVEFTAFVFAFVVLSWLTWRKKIPITWLFFSWAALILPTFSGTLSSMPRYLLTIFPIYIALALIPKKEIKIAILTIFIILLVLFTTLFARGYWLS